MCLFFLKSSFNYTDANAKSLFCFLQGRVIDIYLQAGELGLGSHAAQV